MFFDQSKIAQSANQELCSVCNKNANLSNQAGCILKESYLQLKVIKNRKENWTKNESKEGSFYQLIKCILSQYKDISKDTFECNHQTLQIAMCDFLGCTTSELQQLSEQLSVQYTKRKYQLSVIKSLLSNLPNSIQSRRSSQKNQSSKQSKQEMQQINEKQQIKQQREISEPIIERKAQVLQQQQLQRSTSSYFDTQNQQYYPYIWMPNYCYPYKMYPN